MDLLLNELLILYLRYYTHRSGACNASSSQSPQDERNVTDMIKYFNYQSPLLRNTNIFEWWDKQAESDLKRVANVAHALPVTQAYVEKFCWV